MTVVIELDRELGAAYVRLTEGPVARSVEYSEGIVIDLDRCDVVVGVEVLDPGQPLPCDDLNQRFVVRADVVELLRLIQPNVGIGNVSRGSVGATAPPSVGQLFGR